MVDVLVPYFALNTKCCVPIRYVMAQFNNHELTGCKIMTSAILWFLSKSSKQSALSDELCMMPSGNILVRLNSIYIYVYI